MAFNSAPFPVKDPIANKGQGLITSPWIDWFTGLVSDVSASATRLQTVALTGQVASIGATSIPLGALATGLYRVTWFVRVTVAASTSSSLIVTLGFTTGGVTCALSGAALTGNTASSTQSETRMLAIDGSTPITYSTTYVSVGGTSMAYAVSLVLEAMET